MSEFKYILLDFFLVLVVLFIGCEFIWVDFGFDIVIVIEIRCIEEIMRCWSDVGVMNLIVYFFFIKEEVWWIEMYYLRVGG